MSRNPDQGTIEFGAAGDPDSEIVIFDESRGDSVVSMVPDAVKERFREALESQPELFELDEQELARELRSKKQTPTATDNRLRLKFWMEFDRVKEHGLKSIEITSVISGVCSRELFYKHYLTRPAKVAWLLCPPVNYSVKLTEALEFGLEQMRDILAQDHISYKTEKDEDGKEIRIPVGIDTKLAALKVSVFKMLDDRKNGAAPQIVRGQVAHLHASIPASDRKMIAQMAESQSEDDLIRKLQDAQRREREVMHLEKEVKSDV